MLPEGISLPSENSVVFGSSTSGTICTLGKSGERVAIGFNLICLRYFCLLTRPTAMSFFSCYFRNIANLGSILVLLLGKAS
jgi:hypothetical protein